MATSDDPDGQDASPYLRVPWPLAALGILVVLGLFLGLGLWATQARRAASASPPVSAPTAEIAATVEPVAPAAPPTGTPPAVLLPTRPVASTPAPTATRAVSLATEQSVGATSTPAAAATATVDPEFAHEIDAFYRHYWDVRANALLTLDTSNLPAVADGDHLKALERVIGQLKEEKRAIDTRVHHDYILIAASQTTVVLLDRYEDRSVYVDPETQATLTKPANDHLDEQYELTKVSDGWKVVNLARAD